MLTQNLGLEKILVVEDELCTKTVLMRILNKIAGNAGQITWVDSVWSARAALRTDHYSLIISDYRLTGKETGMDLWHECEKRYPEVPFLMISGMEVPAFVRLSRAGKMPAFLHKPFYVDDCGRVISGLMHIEWKNS